MGDALIKSALFPAIGDDEPEDDIRSKNIVWDQRPPGSPLSGVKRPFLWLPAPSGAKTTLIYFHANGEDLGFVESHLRRLRDGLGVSVLAVEYPGYGPLRGGNVAEASVAEIVGGIDSAGIHALWYVVSELGVPPSQVVIHGHSLGSGPALRLAIHAQEHLRVGGLILQCPFLSLKKAASDIFGSVGHMVMPDHYDNLAALRQLLGGSAKHKLPLMIVHGEKDTVIPPYHGHALHEEAVRLGHSSIKTWFPEDATHNDWDAAELAVPIREFLRAHDIIPPDLFETTVLNPLGEYLMGCNKAPDRDTLG